MKPFGNYIRDIREEKGLSLRKSSEILGVDKAYLSRLENSQISPSLNFINEFSQKFNCDIDVLLIASGRFPETLKDKIEIDEIKSIDEIQFINEKKIGLRARAIERDFPIKLVNSIADMESWRKEVYRPIYHIHKWWAQRLGSVFRSIILGVCLDENNEIVDSFYKSNKFSNRVIFDPFMGSGTTIGEALKLKCRVIGRDINPVSYFISKTAFDDYKKKDVIKEFNEIENDVANKIKYFYRSKLADGSMVDVLYYFWVKYVPCPACKKEIDLFPSRIFSKHAYIKRYPEVRSLCPNCGGINKNHNKKDTVHCISCNINYIQHRGNYRGQFAKCPYCNNSFKIIRAVQNSSYPPKHRMYAKLVLLPNGKKEYFPITDFDEQLYAEASRKLAKSINHYPVVKIIPGNNTNQVLNYNYSYWHEMFNQRQLLVLGILANRIKEIEDKVIRNLFICLFSGCLEFNNMFCSFKGEGTGAVRHMFSHHILKPEKTPLEANLWGTPKSSGSFSTLFWSRIIKAIEYKDNPFEIKPIMKKGKRTSKKVYNLNENLYFNSVNNYQDFKRKKARLYLSCGNSAVTDIENKAVDFVITDPPFFDNVNYSELADFFYVWQRHFFIDNPLFKNETTRSSSEVQSQSNNIFTNNFMSVLLEIHRVLKDDGRLVFTYHHSKNEGWTSILIALFKAHFTVIRVYPVKSEMSVATPKSQAKNPIDIDIILICRKINGADLVDGIKGKIFMEAKNQTKLIIKEWNGNGKFLSKNDVRVIFMAYLISKLLSNKNLNDSIDFLNNKQDDIDKILNDLSKEQKHSSLF